MKVGIVTISKFKRTAETFRLTGVAATDKINHLNDFKSTLTSLISHSLLLCVFVSICLSLLLFPFKDPDMQIHLSNCETAAKKNVQVWTFFSTISLLTDFLSHFLPLHFSCTHNSTLLFSPKYSSSLYHVGMNEGELARHKNIQQNKSFNLALNLTRGDKFKKFPWSLFETNDDLYSVFLKSIASIISKLY